MYKEKIAVVGAGFSGLAVMAAFQRHGILFDGFEADEQIGGNWLHGVYETVHIISSKKTTQYPEYPMPDLSLEVPPLSIRVLAGRTPTTRELALMRSPAASKAHGLPRQPSGTTAISKPCSNMTGS
ncbi:NAD(P)-binding protein [Leptolyngbya sp. 7M]|uniref:NAD(P)-binding protein n=1 Tax=Leptolyngbya sp. 7M TaxID=2812896 RepID=UPI0021F0F84E|nr:NAD(P)-binding protein [Leptolyngbya sp. 7M]